MSTLERATALVVRGTDFSETSKITTLWTREFGKVRAIAKGGRRLKSNFDCAFDLLTVCHVNFIRKSGGLDLLTEAQVRERFAHLRTDLPALYAGYYVAELLDATQDYDPHPALYDAALHTLRAVGGAAAGRGAALAAFELVWLRELGYSPRLETCAACGVAVPEAAEPGRKLGFSPAAGGVVCPRCLSGVRDHQALLPPVWLGLKRLAAGEPVLDTGVRLPLVRTVSYVLGRRPRMLGYMDPV